MSAFSQSEVVLCPFASCPVVTYLSVTSDSTVCGRIRAGALTCARNRNKEAYSVGKYASHSLRAKHVRVRLKILCKKALGS